MQFLLSFLAFAAVIACVQSFQLGRHHKVLRTQSIKLGNTIYDATNSLLTAAAEVAEKSDSYVYGTVNAPSWVLPVGAVFAILTAAIPILLRPGEKALDQQRINEETTNTQFNKRKNKDLL
jgi:hypothetical protein